MIHLNTAQYESYEKLVKIIKGDLRKDKSPQQVFKEYQLLAQDYGFSNFEIEQIIEDCSESGS